MATTQGPRWVGDQPPEQADIDMMNRYARMAVEEAARPSSGPIPWVCAVFILLTLVTGVAQWQGWVR